MSVPVNTDSTAKQGKGYRKELGFWTVVFLATGAILGPAVGFTPASVVALAGPAGILSWIIAFFLMLAVAMSYVELGTMWPRAGGVAYYAARSSGPIVGVMNAWGSLIGYSLAVPAIVVAFVEYLSYWFPALFHNGSLTAAGIITSIVTLIAVGIINMMRIRYMGEINNVLTVLVIIGILIMVIALFGHFNGQNFTQYHGFMSFGTNGLFLAISATIFGFGGFRQPIDYAEEVKDPGKTIPKAVVITMVITLVVFFIESFAFVGAINWSGMGLKVGDWAGISSLGYPFLTLAKGAGLPIIGLIAMLTTLVASFKDGYIYFGGASRVGYSMGRYDGYLPATFKKMSNNGIPWSAAILTFVISCVYIILLPSFSSLFPLVVSALLLSYAPGPLSLAIFRKRHPDEIRPYRLPAQKLLSPIAFVVSSLMIYWAGWAAVRVLIPSVFIGLLLLFFYVRKARITGDDMKYAIWFVVYELFVVLISWLGSSNFGGNNTFASPWDSIVFVLCSIGFYYWGYASGVAYKGNAVFDDEEVAAKA